MRVLERTDHEANQGSSGASFSKPESAESSPTLPGQDSRPAVCIIVENQAVPFDWRVWQEARALFRAGYRVSVICPKGPGCESSRETIEGIDIYRHRILNARGRGSLAYLLEYGFALVAEFFLTWKVYARTRFQVLHGCNPPDLLFLIALMFKPLGVRFVFDHHDLGPELYDVKFRRKGWIHRFVLLAERMTFRFADFSIATNESYREIAIARGRMQPSRTVVVQTCADLREVNDSQPSAALKRGKRYMVAYVGVMEAQDGVRLLMESIAYLVKEKRREDTLFLLIGSGAELPFLRTMAAELGVESFVEFTGLIPHERVGLYLSTADVCVAPDPLNSLNDKCTMIKILEYMAHSRPVVLYDLQEGRRTAGDGALYARPNDPVDFANQIEKLLESEPLRRKLGDCNRRRTERDLNWTVQSARLIGVYESLLKRGRSDAASESELQRTGMARSQDPLS